MVVSAWLCRSTVTTSIGDFDSRPFRRTRISHGVKYDPASRLDGFDLRRPCVSQGLRERQDQLVGREARVARRRHALEQRFVQQPEVAGVGFLVEKTRRVGRRSWLSKLGLRRGNGRAEARRYGGRIGRCNGRRRRRTSSRSGRPWPPRVPCSFRSFLLARSLRFRGTFRPGHGIPPCFSSWVEDVDRQRMRMAETIK